MKTLRVTLGALLLCSCVGFGQSSQEVTPPTIREAEKVTNPDGQVPPMFGPPPPRPVSADRLRKEAQELSDLVHPVAAEVDEAANGKLPKDLNQRLKQIEKLSKKLRRDLEP